VNEEITVSALGDRLAGGVVDLTAAHRLARTDSLLKQGDCRIARVANGEPDLLVTIGRRAKRSHPCLIGEDAGFLARPKIHQKDVATLDRR
jgi:hypothetical protein